LWFIFSLNNEENQKNKTQQQQPTTTNNNQQQPTTNLKYREIPNPNQSKATTRDESCGGPVTEVDIYYLRECKYWLLRFHSRYPSG